MEILAVCRVCLSENTVQHDIINTQLQIVYEKLTQIPLQSEDMRPLSVCYVCYAQLHRSHRLMQQCLRAENILTQMLTQVHNHGDEVHYKTTLTDRKNLSSSLLSISPTEQNNIESETEDDVDQKIKYEQDDGTDDVKTLAYCRKLTENHENELEISSDEVSFATPKRRPASPSLPGPSSGKRSRRSLPAPKKHQLPLSDSGSEDDVASDGDEDGESDLNPINMCMAAGRLRQSVLLKEEEDATEEEIEERPVDMHGDTLNDKVDSVRRRSRKRGKINQTSVDIVQDMKQTFDWCKDFSKFSGREETYSRNPGPKLPRTSTLLDVFLFVWDLEIVQYIVDETNKYAKRTMSSLAESECGTKNVDSWVDMTVEEVYRLIAIINYMSLCYRSRVDEYWKTGVLGMSQFRNIMTRKRFYDLMKFLHFVDNDIVKQSSSDRKISKIEPILSHCNKKFCDMYIPQKHLSLDETLLHWKSQNWSQGVAPKPRIGIKSIELCESDSGYMLRSLLYAGKNSTVERRVHWFEKKTTKVVRELLEGFLDVGHTIVIDNWYDQLPLSRYLKLRHTDVIGGLHHRRAHNPDEIKAANERGMARGDTIAHHCDDITMISWKDVKLITAMSTYHKTDKVKCRRVGEEIIKPRLIHDFDKHMGGVDQKDLKLSIYLFERKRGMKWYMKVFRRLLNTSLLNSFIVYSKINPNGPEHRQFRHQISEGLLAKYGPTKFYLELSQADVVRLEDRSHHFPYQTEPDLSKRPRGRCVRCTAKGKRTRIRTTCTKCKVPLCIGPCWEEYHTLQILK